jgi:hypothetical protein
MSPSSACLSLPDPTTAPIAPSRDETTNELATGTTLHLFLFVALYALPILVSLRPTVVDPDIWWHLRVGEWVVEHDTVPKTDPFSSYGQDKPWIAYSWLFEVLVFRLHELFGLTGIVVYRAALSLSIVAAFHRLILRREPRFLVATGLTLVATVALSPLFNERPWLCTILFTILTLDAILDVRAGRSSWLVWLLPFAFALWANLHIQFVYGLFLLGLACVAPLVDSSLSRSGFDCRGPALSGRMLLLTVLCLLATLVNPYHVRIYRVVLEYATQPGPFRYVNELLALTFRDLWDWVMLILAASAAFALGRRQRLSSFDVLLLASAGVFAFRSRRDLWFLVLASAAILATQNTRPIAPSARFLLKPRQWIVVSITLAALIGSIVCLRDFSERNMRREVAKIYPVEAVAAVAEHGYEGPLSNDFAWGGFLIHRLPQLPVAIDGRTNLHGDERILRFANTWAAGPGWRDDPDLSMAGVIVADAQTPLACVLGLDDRFQLVYEDRVARVFIRRRPALVDR